MKPLARRSGIFAENLPKELILYDKTNDKVHCLNRTAATIWESSDGSKTVDDLAHIVEAKSGVRADRNLVVRAIEELKKAGLMEAGGGMVAGAGLTSRREAVGKIAMAGSALVATIFAAPPTAHASSGAPPYPPPLPITHDPPEPPPIGPNPPNPHPSPIGPTPPYPPPPGTASGGKKK